MDQGKRTKGEPSSSSVEGVEEAFLKAKVES